MAMNTQMNFLRKLHLTPSGIVGFLAVSCALLIGWLVGVGNWRTGAVLVAIPVVLMWPVQIALGSYAFLVPFDSGALMQGDGSSGRTLVFFVGAAASCVLIATGVAGKRLRWPPREAWWWIVFVAWCSATTFWAIDENVALRHLPTAVACLGLYLAVVCVEVKREEFDRIAGFTVLGACIAALYASWLFYGGIGWAATTLRASLISGDVELNPNVFATRLLLPLALSIAGCFAAKSGVWRAVALAGCAALGLGALLAMSRSVLLAILVMAAVFLLRLGVTRRMLTVFAVFGVLALFTPAALFLRITKTAADRGAGRLDIWQVGFEALKHYGLFGAGLSNFPVAYSLYAGFAPHFKGYLRDPHNIYLGIAVEYGVVGVVLFFLAIRSQMWAVKRVYGENRQANIWVVACEASGWSILAACLFENLMWEKSFWLGWIMLTLATQLYSHTGKREPHHDHAHQYVLEVEDAGSEDLHPVL
jgi:O-antigen ligase